MKYQFIHIRNLVTFKCAQITDLQWTPNDPVQLILGTNGSGKSNLMRQLSPLPPISTDYLSDGYRKLVIEHEGHEYVLISDFSLKSGVHKFIRDGESLNEGGTSDVQKDLVTTHLGWTSLVESLCYNTISFNSLSTGQREHLFTKLNPRKIDFVLEKAKKAKSRIRACKTVLTRLMDRKVILEGKMLEQDLVAKLNEEASELNRILKILAKGLVQVETHLKSIGSLDTQDYTGYEQKIHRYIQELKTRWGEWSEVDRTNPQRYLSHIESDIKHYTEDLSHLDTKLQDLQQVLTKDHDRLHEFEVGDQINILKAEISSLEQELSHIESIHVENPFPSNVLRDKDQVLSQLRTILSAFEDAPTPLLTRRQTTRKEHHFRQWVGYHREIQQMISKRDQDLYHLNKSLTLKLTDIPESPCAKGACPLYIGFKNSYDRTQQQIVSITHERERLLAKEHRLSRWLEAQEKQLEFYRPYSQRLQSLFEVIQNYPYLHSFFNHPTILNQISSNGMALYHRIEKNFTDSALVAKLPDLRVSLLTKKNELSKIESLSDGEKLQLERLIAQHEKTIESYRTEKRTLLKKITRAEEMKAHNESYLKALSTLTTLQGAMEDKLQVEYKRHEKSKLEDLQRILSEKYDEMSSRIRDIESVISEQNALSGRYQEEVINIIFDTEQEKLKYEKLLEALEAIPQECTVEYLNIILNIANAVIGKVFTYPLTIDPVPVDKSVSFKFPFVAKNASVPDIAKCSTAQAEIMNFAFSLAARLCLGLGDYPLFLDEIGKTFDPAHQQKLLDLFIYIQDEHLATQLFIVNHHAVIHGGLMNTETLVLSDSNIMKTENYNHHVVMETY
mgnify:FL=1